MTYIVKTDDGYLYPYAGDVLFMDDENQAGHFHNKDEADVIAQGLGYQEGSYQVFPVDVNNKQVNARRGKADVVSLSDIIFCLSRRESVLTPLSGATALTVDTLTKKSCIGSGTFSRVYGNGPLQVIKFSWDFDTLMLLKRLGDQSTYFTKVYDVIKDQAVDEDGKTYHAAIVERLRKDIPSWVRSLVDFYRQPWRAESGFQSFQRLVGLKYQILTSQIYVEPGHAEGLAEAIGLLAEECRVNQFIADLRTETNIMTRSGGQIVISDPAHPQKRMC